MTHPHLRSLALILAMSLGGGLAQAQENNSPSDSTAVDQELKDKAFRLLESVAGQLGTLQSTENRARIGSNLIDSLWEHDEQRARSLAGLVEQDIRAGLQLRDSRDQREARTFMVFLNLRGDTVERIAKHDAELALSFLKSTQIVSDKPLPYGVEKNDRALELRLAHAIAASNPDLALKLGRQSLAQGFPVDLLTVLRQLHSKHREQGTTLYKDVVAKLRNSDLFGDWNVTNFARNLASMLSPPAVDEGSYRELINLFISSALAHGCANKTPRSEGGYLCGQIGWILPQMDKVDPQRAAQLKHWAPAYDPSIQQGVAEFNTLSERGTVDELLALAPKYPRMETQIYSQAINKAQESGNVERARKIASDYIRDPEMRRRILDQIDRNQEWATITDDKLADLQRRLGAMPVRMRVEGLLSVALRVGTTDKSGSIKLLNLANTIVDEMSPGHEQTETQLGLARVYCMMKSDRGFEVMERLMPRLNGLVDGAVKLDGFDTHYLREGEWNMSAEGSVGRLLTQLAQSAGYFAWCDFDRAVSMTAQFERSEIRLMAQLKLAQGILAGPPRKLGSRPIPQF